MVTPVAIDTDPGVDDAIALMLAMRSPELRVELLTTVAGNVPVAVGTRNARRLVALVNPKRWPTVATGAARPLTGKLETATHVHNRDGLGGNARRFPVPRGFEAEKDGVGKLIRFTREHGGEGVIIAVGPLTNIARALQRAPDVMATLGRLIIMGGAVRVPGNVTPAAEFNIYVDPEAAEVVFEAGLAITLIPLDVTRQVRLTTDRLSRVGRQKLAGAARHIAAEGAAKFDGMAMHDSLAVAAAIDASIVGTEALSVKVETQGTETRGMTLADLRDVGPGPEPNMQVATSVNAQAMLELLERRVLGSAPAAPKTGRVTVVGSANIDLSIAVAELPRAGETVLGKNLVQAFGGKGANQAVAASRARANVNLVARFGDDSFADEWQQFLVTEGIDDAGSTRDASARTGVATITISAQGENQIAVASGANAKFSPAVLKQALEDVAAADVLVTQLEIPVTTVKFAHQKARKHGVLTVHNPAPAQPLPAGFLKLVDVLVCNEVEAEMLSAVAVHTLADARRAVAALQAQGVAVVVLTLGARGVVYSDASGRRAKAIAGLKVKAIDTTGAGDTFVGYLATGLAQGLALEAALALANKAAAKSVTKRGAVPSIPLLATLRR